MTKPRFQSPKGLRDYYPADMLRRRYIEKAWRDVSLRHGFDEIEGPMFEHTELYTVKSGEAILGEIFGVFSGKDPQQVAAAGAGQTPYALRPEFTPSMARMYAARAGQLARPTKWFMSGPFFRAERPQRGRLREFLQWNVDFLAGEDEAQADADTIACCIELLSSLGLSPRDVRISINDRRLVADLLAQLNVPADRHDAAMTLLDRAERMKEAELHAAAEALGLDRELVSKYRAAAAPYADAATVRSAALAERERLPGLRALAAVYEALDVAGLSQWLYPDPMIVRGLAYYTGMVFEVHEATGAERAIAGGGRYDKLIELFGGPPTPAVGFGMGDVVLSLVLQDRGLLPEGAALMDCLAARPASPRPDGFVISNNTPEADAALRPLVAGLRRGDGNAPPLHIRHSYKATKNLGKLLKEASDTNARFAIIIESAAEATVKDLAARSEQRMALDEIGGHLSR